jgi:microcystin-dependent protein
MSCIQTCEPCAPCETSIVEACISLEETVSAKRIIVEDTASCKKTIKEPEGISILQYGIDQDISWRDGSSNSIVEIPSLQNHDIDMAPKIIVTDNSGTLKQWMPSSVGDNFLAYWDGSDFVIGTLSSLFPSSDGVFVKSGNNLSFVNGINGQILTIDGQIQFDTIALGEPPAGTIMAYGGTVAPTGYFLCDGSAVSRVTYANLFALLGTIYGPGDGTTTFNLPDYRGVFLRGLDPSRTMGSLQNQEIQLHTHNIGSESSHTHSITGNTGTESASHQHYGVANIFSNNALTSANYIAIETNLGNRITTRGSSTVPTLGLTSNQITNHTHNYSFNSGAGSSHLHSINPDGTTETVPVNVALNFIIKT